MICTFIYLYKTLFSILSRQMIKKTLKWIGIILLIYVIYCIFSFWYHLYKFRDNWCITTPWGCNEECQDVIDECFKDNCKPWVECYCPNDCKYYKNFTWNSDIKVVNESAQNQDLDQWEYDSNLEDEESFKDSNKQQKELKRPQSQDDCPAWTKFQCPMWMCFNEETFESYPCQHTCFCTDPDLMF